VNPCNLTASGALGWELSSEDSIGESVEDR
jgi:hypothetical protein